MATKTDVIEEITRQLKSIETTQFKDDYEDVLAFYVASQIVESDDIDFVNMLPKKVADKVYEIAHIYETKGEYKIYSNLGCKDHSEMAKQLSIILKQ